MDHLVANSGKAKSVTRNGREYLVVPASLIVPGVLNGSKGRLYYSPKHTQKSVEKWNGTPITMYHPTANGEYVSAKDSSVKHYGWLENASYRKKLTSEAWIDVERTKTHPEGEYVLNRLLQGLPVELSTGLYTEDLERNGIDSRSGQAYTHFAVDYRPDHLAILPSQTGACSLRDGCGLNVNAKPCCDECKSSQSCVRSKPMKKCPECSASMTTNSKEVMICSGCGYKAKLGPTVNAKANCGIGTGGFSKGNKCASGGGGGGSTAYDKAKAEVSKAVDAAYSPGSALQKHKRSLKAAKAHRKAATHASSDADKDHHDSEAVMFESSAAKSLDKHYSAKASRGKSGPTTNTPEVNPPMKKKLVNWLVVNCDCWKGQEAVLNRMEEPRLKALRRQALAADEAADVLKTVKDTLGVNTLTASTLKDELVKLKAGLKQPTNVVVNAKKPAVVEDEDEDEDEEETPAFTPKGKKKMPTVVTNTENEQLMDEYKQVVEERRQELAGKIVTNMRFVNEDARKKKYAKLLKLNTAELREELDGLAPVTVTANAVTLDDSLPPGYVASRLGAAAQPTANRGANNEPLEPIPTEVIDWSELSAFGK